MPSKNILETLSDIENNVYVIATDFPETSA